MRFKGLDLNLLVAFEILMEEHSVRRAAARLRLSQPATSSALARLRTFFNDPILVVDGKRMYSTPYADSLLPQVRECLSVARSLIETSSAFDPATSPRIFRIVASDYIVAALLSPVASKLAVMAPRIRLEFILPDSSTVTKVERGEVDLLITPAEWADSSLTTTPLFEERHVVVGCRDNPLFASELTEEGFMQSGHVAVSVGANATVSYADHQLSLIGKTRRVELTAASFAVLPWLVMGTTRLVVMHERLARTMKQHLPIEYRNLPFSFPLMKEVIQFHRSRAADVGLAWLIGQIEQQAQAI